MPLVIMNRNEVNFKDNLKATILDNNKFKYDHRIRGYRYKDTDKTINLEVVNELGVVDLILAIDRLKKKSAVDQLMSLKLHCQEYLKDDEIWQDDVDALDIAIDVLKGDSND